MTLLCLRIRRYANNVKRSSKEVQEMYEKEGTRHLHCNIVHWWMQVAHACSPLMNASWHFEWTVMAFYHIGESSGAELKKLFLESGGNFDLVEMKVKQWVENKKISTNLESRVSKRQLKEKYFWDDVPTPADESVIWSCSGAQLARVCTHEEKHEPAFLRTWSRTRGNGPGKTTRS